jgi:hypothetical protein
VAWIPVSALVVSLATLIHVALANRRKFVGEDLDAVAKRLGIAEEEIRRCTADRTDLRNQLFQNMSDLVELRRAGAKKGPARKQ